MIVPTQAGLVLPNWPAALNKILPRGVTNAVSTAPLGDYGIAPPPLMHDRQKLVSVHVGAICFQTDSKAAQSRDARQEMMRTWGRVHN